MFGLVNDSESIEVNKHTIIEIAQERQHLLVKSSLTDGTIPSVGTKVEGRVVRGRKNPYWSEFSERLRRMRVDSGLSMNALALIAGVDSAQVFSLENGARPRISTIESIAAALGVPACFLAFGDRGERPFTFRIPRDEQPLPIRAPNAQPDDQLHAGFAARLTRARELRGMSLRELSRRASLSVTSVSNYERAITLPLIDAVEQLAFALDVSPCWLAYGTGDEPQPLVSSPSA